MLCQFLHFRPYKCKLSKLFATAKFLVFLLTIKLLHSFKSTMSVILNEKRIIDNCSNDIFIDNGQNQNLMLSLEEMDMYRNAILNPIAMLQNGTKVDYLTEPALVTSLGNWAICGPMHSHRKLVPVPLTETFMSTWKPNNHIQIPKLSLASRLQSTKTSILDYLIELEDAILSSSHAKEKDLVFIASHGIVSDLPLHRWIMVGLDKMTRNSHENYSKILVITCEIRISTREKKSKGYLTLNDDGSLSLIDIIQNFNFTASPIHENVLKSFVIVPYFRTSSCVDIMQRYVDKWQIRNFKASFIGCISTLGPAHHGFRVRELLKTAFTRVYDDEEDHFSITDTCVGKERKNLKPSTTWKIYENSDFCLVTGGDSISSVKIYDALSCLCIPIFTDGATMLPFVEDVPWQKMSFYHEVQSLKDAIDLRKKLASCVLQEEILNMRNIISQNIHKLLWNWEGGETCPDWMKRPSSELPGGLLRKYFGGDRKGDVNIVSRMNMNLQDKC